MRLVIIENLTWIYAFLRLNVWVQLAMRPEIY